MADIDVDTVVSRLREIEALAAGASFPSWCVETGGWGAPLSALQGRAANVIERLRTRAPAIEWMPIETAPLLTYAELAQRTGGMTLYNYYFECLIQNKRGAVNKGHARYVQAQGNALKRNWVLRWYVDGRGWEKQPRYWMPLPAPRKD